jgi:hypothetical protein
LEPKDKIVPTIALYDLSISTAPLKSIAELQIEIADINSNLNSYIVSFTQRLDDLNSLIQFTSKNFFRYSTKDTGSPLAGRAMESTP